MFRQRYWITPPMFPFPGYRPDFGPPYIPPPSEIDEKEISQRPKGPPPKDIPKKDIGTPLKAVDPGGIRRCMYNYVYIWTVRDYGYWAWLTYVGRKSIAGYRWIGYRWIYFGTDLDNIASFYCYR